MCTEKKEVGGEAPKLQGARLRCEMGPQVQLANFTFLSLPLFFFFFLVCIFKNHNRKWGSDVSRGEAKRGRQQPLQVCDALKEELSPTVLGIPDPIPTSHAYKTPPDFTYERHALSLAFLTHRVSE
jgi:hypothetical protein